MALRRKLSKPFVVEPTLEHTHAVVFLHRFPESTSDEELPRKVLSAKRTRNHKTLREQFPGIRWVFPFAKTGARPYGNLSADDKTAVGMATTHRSPYITQILLQEAKRAGGLDRVILGGQGETAVAAHEAMASFPEIRSTLRNQPDEVASYLRDTFHTPSWTDIATHPRLAGFVGMHAEEREATRDIANYGIASKEPNDPPLVNTSIIINTPHCFIHGGYKVQTTTWDGRRIDDFAKFLAVDLGIYRVADPEGQPGRNETLTPKDRREQKQAESKEELNDAQKYALELAKNKKENEALVKKIRQRIEADKVERKFRQQRERQARGILSYNADAQIPSGSAKGGDDDDVVHRDGGEGGYENEVPRLPKRPRKQLPGRRAAGDADWETPSGIRGEMGEARMRAFGLISDGN
ncbi:hypothetical protein MMYC01_205981 [Madurella mycetomatis]|uniref:Uncharacterized protein n=1 Tax=Madurella mycetomatis TaxID=100816 RepID=A0A175W1M2_9PEZI|nr:hypothetical protein MMYC01_205981 [Madurella mycetomatis]